MSFNRTSAALISFAILFGAFTPASALAEEAVPLAERIELCQSCHGEVGVPIETAIPIIAGQEFYYIYVQLRDYKAGRRANAVMSEIAADMTKKDMKALAEHFSKMDWPRIASGADKEIAKSGENGLAAGQCSQCHSTYSGDSRVPRLAGQHLDYLEHTMAEFKNKVRLNSPAKGSLMNSFSDEDIAAMAHNLAGR